MTDEINTDHLIKYINKSIHESHYGKVVIGYNPAVKIVAHLQQLQEKLNTAIYAFKSIDKAILGKSELNKQYTAYVRAVSLVVIEDK